MKFISTETIKKTYTELTNIDVKNASIFHIFLILKGCGINDTLPQPVETITEKGYPIARDLSLLFSFFEEKPEKYDFINPFSMKEWAAQAPSETLKKWVSSRIKNNIIGGATTWRKIIREDIYNNKIKFAKNYVEEIKDLTIPNNKIKLWPLVIWYNRFTKFNRSYSPNELIQGFVKELNITERELGILFDKTVITDIKFSEKECDMSKIRNLIGTPPNTTSANWNKSTVISVAEPQEYYQFKNKFMNNQNNVSVDKILKLIKNNFQIILSGPPGTSKSYIADIVSKKITDVANADSVLKIQFHPQYSYQDFIGGFIVNGDKVETNRGVFLRFLDKVKDANKENFVLIIDEINRANVGSVFGELIQCLDRNYSLSTLIAGKQELLHIPKNLFIIATMNTSDRTLGSIDFALRRRFVDIYIAANESILTDTTKTECEISLADFLKKINTQLKITLRNNELVIGQTIFYNESVKSGDMYNWNNENLEDLFNYKILSMVEDYCNKEVNKVNEVVGDKLSARLTGDAFVNALSEYIA
jgi:5-methylcytosine-specific restriction protein B